MNTISECLRALYLANPHGHIGCGTVAKLAADEIDRLEADNERLRKIIRLINEAIKPEASA